MGMSGVSRRFASGEFIAHTAGTPVTNPANDHLPVIKVQV
jgi:hypothetical protein